MEVVTKEREVSRYWCVTLWTQNLPENWWDTLVSQTSPEVKRIAYFVAGKEVCPSTGKEHWQGYVQFKVTVRMSALAKMWGPKHHFEVAYASDAANFNYCVKEGREIKEFGTKKKTPGARTDLKSAVDTIRSGGTVHDLWEKHTDVMIRYHRGMTLAHEALNGGAVVPKYTLAEFEWKPITDWTRSHIVWGPPGCGKTEFAKAHFPKGCLFVCHIDDLMKFKPDIHEGIVFDDMNFCHLPRSTQIYLLDVDNPRSIHCRNYTAFIPAGTKKIFTCNEKEGRIFEFFKDDVEDVALTRRAEIHFVTRNVTEVSEGNTVPQTPTDTRILGKKITLTKRCGWCGKEYLKKPKCGCDGK